MAQQSGLFIANKSGFSNVPRPSAGNISYFLNSNAGDALYGMKSDGSVFPVNTGLLTFTVPLTSAQIKTLNSAPVELVSAQGAGKGIVLISTETKFTPGAVAFDNNAAFIQCPSALAFSGEQAQMALFFDDATASVGKGNMIGGGQADQKQIFDNESLIIKALADSTTNGDGTAVIYGTYKIINV